MITVALQGIRGGVGTTSIVAGLALAARRQGAGCWLLISVLTINCRSISGDLTMRCAGGVCWLIRQTIGVPPSIAGNPIWICWLRAVLRDCCLLSGYLRLRV